MIWLMYSGAAWLLSTDIRVSMVEISRSLGRSRKGLTVTFGISSYIARKLTIFEGDASTVTDLTAGWFGNCALELARKAASLGVKFRREEFSDH